MVNALLFTYLYSVTDCNLTLKRLFNFKLVTTCIFTYIFYTIYKLYTILLNFLFSSVTRSCLLIFFCQIRVKTMLGTFLLFTERPDTFINNSRLILFFITWIVVIEDLNNNIKNPQKEKNMIIIILIIFNVWLYFKIN